MEFNEQQDTFQQLLKAICSNSYINVCFEGNHRSGVIAQLTDYFERKNASMPYGFTVHSGLSGESHMYNNCRVDITVGNFLGQFTQVEVYPQK